MQKGAGRASGVKGKMKNTLSQILLFLAIIGIADYGLFDMNPWVFVWMAGFAVIARQLLKRSINGPQMWFARSASLCLLLGIVALKFSDQPGGFMPWASAIFLLVGLIVGIAMTAVDIWWTLRPRDDVRQP